MLCSRDVYKASILGPQIRQEVSPSYESRKMSQVTEHFDGQKEHLNFSSDSLSAQAKFQKSLAWQERPSTTRSGTIDKKGTLLPRLTDLVKHLLTSSGFNRPGVFFSRKNNWMASCTSWHVVEAQHLWAKANDNQLAATKRRHAAILPFANQTFVVS